MARRMRKEEREEIERVRAYKKEKGKKVIIPPSPNKASSDQEFLDEVAKQALSTVLMGVKESIRNRYAGDVQTKVNTSGTGAICVTLTPVDSNQRIIVERIAVPAHILEFRHMTEARLLGRSFGNSISRRLIDRPDVIATVHEEYKDSLPDDAIKPKKKVKPKKVCKICGPDDPYYPPWALECEHD